MTVYPMGYGSTLVTLERLQEVHGPKMHPEFYRRIWPWLESMNGLIGIGSGWRSTQPALPGFAPDGKSFHQSQTFRSGIVAYCALDLVARNGAAIHRSPTWAETTTAREFLLHTFITGEPWHIQPIEIRGWQTWKDAGSPDPVAPIPQPPEDDMQILDKPYRAWDSREHGAPLQAGQTITVPVGQCSRADIVIGSIGVGGSGYLYVNGADNTSAVGYSGSSPVQRCGIPVATPGGNITVSAVVSAAHFTIDVYAVA